MRPNERIDNICHFTEIVSYSCYTATLTTVTLILLDQPSVEGDRCVNAKIFLLEADYQHTMYNCAHQEILISTHLYVWLIFVASTTGQSLLAGHRSLYFVTPTEPQNIKIFRTKDSRHTFFSAHRSLYFVTPTQPTQICHLLFVPFLAAMSCIIDFRIAYTEYVANFLQHRVCSQIFIFRDSNPANTGLQLLFIPSLSQLR